MNCRNLPLAAVIAASLLALPVYAGASDYEDDLEYNRGYEACASGAEDDSSETKGFREGCADAKMGRQSRTGHGDEPSAQHDAGLDKAIQACRKRSVEGSRYRVEDTEVLQVTQVGADRYHLDIKSPAANIRCAVTTEGEIFSVDEI
jgi:hypothetical protein